MRRLMITENDDRSINITSDPTNIIDVIGMAEYLHTWARCHAVTSLTNADGTAKDDGVKEPIISDASDGASYAG